MTITRESVAAALNNNVATESSMLDNTGYKLGYSHFTAAFTAGRKVAKSDWALVTKVMLDSNVQIDRVTALLGKK